MSFIDDIVTVFNHESFYRKKDFYTEYYPIRRILTCESTSSNIIIRDIPHSIINLSAEYELKYCDCKHNLSDVTRISSVQVKIPISFINKIRNRLGTNEVIADIDDSKEKHCVQLNKFDKVTNELCPIHISDIDSKNYNKENRMLYVPSHMFLECLKGTYICYYLRVVAILD
jgi:hypothetical protein